MRTVFLCSPLRTPVGKYGGLLSSVRPDDMAALLLQAMIEKNSLDPSAIDDVVLGCANQAGEDNRNVARMAVLLAGLPHHVPGVTVNRLCASSLEAVIVAARAIMAGEADLIIAGGVESMSRAPYVLPKNVSGRAVFGNLTAYDTALGWRFPNPAMEKLFPLESMGETAENVAERYSISRADQDAYALRSHQLAIAAYEDGFLQGEIMPVVVRDAKGNETTVGRDEGPRTDTSLEKLAQLPPAFRKNGTVTAGNSSSLNDGAAAVIVASEKAVQQYNLQPLARYLAGHAVGVDPRYMGIGPVEAIPGALRKAGISIEQVDLFEINEAFAAQVLACQRLLNIPLEKLNVHGGAIAIGHPLGMSGARILGTLIRALHRHNGRYGVASLCVGVGQGVAAVVERVS
ncbi:MAG: thiolase family protein [Bacteroidota bacterium]|nr:thiolase family protein [Candidatus Kapabacteria bacterium]MCS7302117.1 thiolase family protein [Candidatus Kapabacteria bacterium]MCX7936491.1 thiolase family protein [Chlorobiota bacterium]MDW8074652.1 thiolase family protein [Bacteroidota bacterium]MDW8270872.1 thiolase family protein [Bacteroidota bacterium]